MGFREIIKEVRFDINHWYKWEVRNAIEPDLIQHTAVTMRGASTPWEYCSSRGRYQYFRGAKRETEEISIFFPLAPEHIFVDEIHFLDPAGRVCAPLHYADGVKSSSLSQPHRTRETRSNN